MTVIDQPGMAATATPRVKRWTKREYNALVDRGFFQGQRLFLYRGELIEMPPMGGLHAHGIMKVSNWLYATFRPDFEIRVQMPFETPGESMPEPDGGVFTPSQADCLPHPERAVMLIEVSYRSLDYDREKAFDYASAGVPEYWIVDVIGRAVEVYRDPVADAAATLGSRYASHQVMKDDQSLASLARPDVAVSVADLLA